MDAHGCGVTAKELRKKQQSHTYINVTPGRRPHIVTGDNINLLKSTLVEDGKRNFANGSADKTVNTGSAGGSGSGVGDSDSQCSRAVVGDDDGVVADEKLKEKDSGRMINEDATQSLEIVGEISRHADTEEMNGGFSPLMEDPATALASGSQPSGPPRQRPLVVHSYENFPFNPNRRKMNTPESPSLVPGPREEEEEEGSESLTPPRSRTGSELSNRSSTPPLPERHYSESETSISNPGPGIFPLVSPVPSPSPSPSQSAQSQEGPPHHFYHHHHENPSPPHSHSRSGQVKREVSEQGHEYAVVNPAWKKNAMGRPPSLTRISGSLTSLEKYGNETPPPLPDRPAHLEHSVSRQSDKEEEFVGLDSDLVKQKREELDIENRFNQSVKYTEVKTPSPDCQSKREAGVVAYDTIDFTKQQGGDGELNC